MFRVNMMKIVTEMPDLPIEKVVRGWDFAGTEEDEIDPVTAALKDCGLHSGGQDDEVQGGTTRIYIVDVVRARLGVEEVQEMFTDTYKADGKNVVQDIPQDPGQGRQEPGLRHGEESQRLPCAVQPGIRRQGNESHPSCRRCSGGQDQGIGWRVVGCLQE